VGAFLSASLLLAMLFVTVSALLSQRAAREEALADARHTTDLLAELVVQPNLHDGLLTGDASAIAALDAVVPTRTVGRDGIVRVKIWSTDGRIVYSDIPALIGRVFALGAEEQASVRDGDTDAEVSDGAAPENVYERGKGRLLEVYRPVHTPSGQALLFETYSSYARATSRAGSIWRSFALITLSAILMTQLLQLPLAWRMVVQLRRGERAREHLMRKALDASADERRRIAGSLHDGVVQDLAGASFLLAGAMSCPGAAKTGLASALAAVRQSIGGLRSLLVELYPPSLAQAGLAAALEDATAALRARGVAVQVRVAERLDLTAEIERLLFRAAQEALRNVAKHARPSNVEVSVRVARHRAFLLVSDDGVGFDPAVLDERSREGHVGLRVLADLVAAEGGTVDVASAPGGGTALRVEVPLT
jgi:signal transduction histidine kinase